MDLIVNQVVQLQEVHIAHGDLVVEGLAGTAVVQDALALGIQSGFLEHILDVAVGGTVEDRRGHLAAQSVGRVAQVHFQHLADVHTGRHAQGVQNDVQRGAVGQEGHILLGQDTGDNALVAVTACHLVAHLDLTALGDIHPDHHVDAGAQLVAVFTGENLGIHNDAALAVGDLQRGVPDFPGLLTEDSPQQPLLGGEVGLALGGDLAHQDVAGADLGADADDAVLVQVLQGVLAHVGDIPGDLLGAQLGIPGVDLVLLNVDGGVQILPDQPLVQKDGVLVVVAFPGHEAHQDVLAQGDLALIGGGAVCQNRGILDGTIRVLAPAVDPLAHRDDGLLVDAGAVVGAQELGQAVILGLAVIIADGDVAGVHRRDLAVALCQDGHLGVDADLVLHAGADDGSVGTQQRHSLALHVCAHQGTVCVVVRQEGDHGGSDGDHHAGGDVDVVHPLLVHLHDLVPVTGRDTGVDEAAVLVQRLSGLADDVVVLLVGGHIGDLVGDVEGLLVHRPVGSLDEAVLIDPGIGGQVGNQADVGACRGLNGAHTAVVAVVDVTDLHVGALTGEAAGAQGGKAPLMGQLRQGVGLIHELAQGAGAEELLDSSGDGPDVDEALGRHDIQILDGHALADDPLHPGKADAELVLQQLAHGTQAAVAQVVDIVLDGDAPGQAVHIVDGGKDIVDDDVLGHQIILVQAQLLLEFLAGVLAQQLLQHSKAHPLLDAALCLGIEVHIALEVAHLVGHHPQGLALYVDGDLAHAHGVQLPGVLLAEEVTLVKEDLAGGGVCHGVHQLVAGNPVPQRQLLIELVPAHDGQIVAPGIEEQVVDQGLAGLHRGGLAGTELPVDLQHGVLIGLAGILFQGHHNAGIIAEHIQDLRVGLEAQGPDQAGDGDLAVLVDADPEDLVGVGLILQPGAPVGDHRGGEDRQVGLKIQFLAVVHTGRADDLRDHHALGTVDDEGAGVGHQGEVAHEDLLLLDLLSLLVAQANLHLQRRCVGGVTGLALLHIVLGCLVHLVVDEGQFQVALIVGDRGDIREDLTQSGVQEPLVRLLLDLQKVGHGSDFLMPGKVLTKGLSVILVFGHLHIHLSSVRPSLSEGVNG